MSEIEMAPAMQHTTGHKIFYFVVGSIFAGIIAGGYLWIMNYLLMGK